MSTQAELWLWLMQTLVLPKTMYPSWEELQPLLAIHAVNMERKAFTCVPDTLHNTLRTLVAYANKSEYQYEPNKPSTISSKPRDTQGTAEDHEWAKAMVQGTALIVDRYVPSAWHYSWTMGVELLLHKDTIVSSMTSFDSVSLDLIP